MSSEDNPRVFGHPPLIFAGLLVLGLRIVSERAPFGAPQLVTTVLGLIGLVLIALA